METEKIKAFIDNVRRHVPKSLANMMESYNIEMYTAVANALDILLSSEEKDILCNGYERVDEDSVEDCERKHKCKRYDPEHGTEVLCGWEDEKTYFNFYIPKEG
jgi:hypothetical protein